MHNLVRIGKGIIIFLIMLAVVDIVWLVYTYNVSINALEDTLSSIALVVAEDNCIDMGTGSSATINSPTADSKLYSIRKLMVENATAWLCYNDKGFSNTSDSSNQVNRGSRSTYHTDIQTDDCRAIETAMKNIDMSYALNLEAGSNYTNDSMYSYTTCPQRGQTITITLKANVNVHLLSLIPSWGNISVPVERQITVIGMKFYKGKEGSE